MYITCGLSLGVGDGDGDGCMPHTKYKARLVSFVVAFYI